MHLKTITDVIVFKNTRASTLFDLYTNAEKHKKVTGSSATITDKLGEPFNLYNGFCFGENIDLKRNKLILQTWRTENWPDGYDDSIVIIRFLEDHDDTYLYLTHADLPSDLAESLHKGWNEFYWNKWKTYLKINQI